MQYRAEIDGLRAIAVLSVIFFHGGFSWFGGGYIGVDIFFVISGYLITTIIYKDLQGGAFNIVNFYERRARRILPALFFMLAICIPFSWILLSPFDLVEFSKSIIAVQLFISNIFFMRGGGYFDTAGELKPLLHTWSLSVEEQFYLIFPIFLIAIYRYSKKWKTLIFVVLASLSLMLCQVASVYLPIPNFFLLPTRVWELTIGVLVAFLLSCDFFLKIKRCYKQILSSLGLFLILFSIYYFGSITPFPSAYALIPTSGTALVILFGQNDTVVGKLLSVRIIVSIGLLSYSAYLFHQPIFSFARHYISSINHWHKLILISLTFILSYLSWRWVESPFRRPSVIPTRTLLFFLSGFTVIYLLISLLTYFSFTSSSDLGSEARAAKLLLTSEAIYSSNMDDRQFIKHRIEYENLSPKTIVLGSSRVMQIRAHKNFNDVLVLGVNGASIEDDIVIAYLALKKFSPDTLILGLDPWLFNLNLKEARWRSLINEFSTARDSLEGIEIHEVVPKNASSQSGLLSSLSTIYRLVNISKYVSSDDRPEIKDKIRRDGSRVYNYVYANKSQSEISSGFEEQLNYGMNNYEHSEQSQQLFEKFLIKNLKKYNVIFVLVPYHPSLFNRIKIENSEIVQAEIKYRELSMKHKVKIIGSYDPAIVGCEASEFYDGMHPKKSCLDKVLNQLDQYSK
jgi:peptidoglycan/LPS O-acetylase OafA/YrhL